MLQPLGEQADDVLIVEGVEDLSSRATRTHEPQAAQQAQLMRDGGLREVHPARKVLDAEFGAREGVEDPDARGVAEHAEGFRERDDRLIVQSVLSRLREAMNI